MLCTYTGADLEDLVPGMEAELGQQRTQAGAGKLVLEEAADLSGGQFIKS